MAGQFSISGIGSGIDSHALAQAIGDRYRLPNVKYQQQVDDNNSENDSLSKLRDLLQNLNDSLDSLRTANGGAGVLEGTTSDETVLRVAAGAGAQRGNYSVSVQSLASVATGSFARSFSSADELLLGSGQEANTLPFLIGTGSDQTSFEIAIDATTTASDFVNRFNEAAQGSAYAAFVNVGTSATPDYRISFASQNQGTAKGTVAFGGSIDAVVNDVLGGSYIEQASDAQFSISGISGSFTRSTNSVTDAIAGVTLELQKTGSALVSVQTSSNGGAAQIEKFVKSFNDLARFVSSEDKIDSKIVDGERENTYGSLARTDVDDNVMSSIRSAIASASSGDGSTSLAALGVSTNRDGTLSFDRKQFDETFNKNPNAANEAVSSLADKVSGVSGVLYQYTGYGLTLDQAVKSNEQETGRLNDTIGNIDRRAAAKEQLVLNQFTQLESLYAQLQGSSNLIASLLG